jgi:coenzyme PQQ synthesis protein D (PqqD)
MNDTQYVARSAKVAARMVGDEMMIMSGQDSTLFALNPTAAAIWEAADGQTPLKQIVERHICTRYDVEPATAIRDAREVVEQLAGEGLFTVSDKPLTAAGTR